MDTPRWTDDDLVMISAIEHWSYCPRQCALIHVEQTFEENVFTLRGQRNHERVHEKFSGSRDGIRVDQGLPLWSDTLGIVGKADVVEWHSDVPFPIEFKTGKHRAWVHEELQLAAQAICLEEMLGVQVPEGAIYSAGSRRRKTVIFTDAHYDNVKRIVTEIRAMLAQNTLPPVANDERCAPCSLKEACAPQIIAGRQRLARAYSEVFIAPEVES